MGKMVQNRGGERGVKNYSGAVHNLKGCIFDRLTVVRETEYRDKTKGRIWVCRCECGNIHLATTGNLRSRKTKSCGCLQREKFKNLPQYNPDNPRKFPPKDDCVFYRVNHCACLSEMVCRKKGKCGFYAPKGDGNG